MGRLLLIGLLAGCAAGFSRAATLEQAEGLVQVRPSGESRWSPAGSSRPLSAGDSVRTGFRARAKILLDGAVLELSGGTQIVLDEAARGGAAVGLAHGAARLAVEDLAGRSLELRAPLATTRARSDAAAWRATVGDGGNALFEVETGLVGVEASGGGVLLLRGGERIETDGAGLHEPTRTPAPSTARREEFAERMRRELSWDQEAGDAQNRVSAEMRREEYESGRVTVDASGARVRVEEFVVRTSPTSFTFVALNGRRGAGLSWNSWTGVFDATLPKDLSGVFALLPGSVDAPAPWTLIAFTSVRSNGVDSLVVRGAGGHQVDLNSNADPTDDVATLYDPVSGTQRNVAGHAVFETLFDRYGVYSDAALKRGWTGTNLQFLSGAVPASTADPLTGAALAAPLPTFTTNTTFPDGSAARQVVLESHSDGTSITTENRSLSSGPGWDSSLLQRSAFEQTTSATEFGSRSIQVILSPRFLLTTGGLP